MNGKTNFDFIILFGLDWFGPFGLKFVLQCGFHIVGTLLERTTITVGIGVGDGEGDAKR